MTDAEAAFLTFVIAPVATVGIVAMLRGYSVWVHLYKPDKEKRDEGKPDADDGDG